MKRFIFVLGLTMISTGAFAAPNSNGPGMYCSPSAEAAAQAIAKINGSSQNDINLAVTDSLDPVQGTDYITKIGNDTYQTSTSANDGDCVVNQVTKK